MGICCTKIGIQLHITSLLQLVHSLLLQSNQWLLLHDKYLFLLLKMWNQWEHPKHILLLQNLVHDFSLSSNLKHIIYPKPHSWYIKSLVRTCFLYEFIWLRCIKNYHHAATWSVSITSLKYIGNCGSFLNCNELNYILVWIVQYLVSRFLDNSMCYLLSLCQLWIIIELTDILKMEALVKVPENDHHCSHYSYYS